ncbi:MAG: glycoside hydrolase family 3 N-terminal domain-containing protein, partial [Armatimonadota bacterium]
MTLEQKIGAMLVFGWAGEGATGVNAHAREIVNEMQVGGVVLLGRNVADNLAETAETLNELQSMSREPLFVIADQEGGMVARFVDGVTVFPSNMAVGATGSPDLAREAAAATARELCAIGCNFNFAPCVDVNNNPDNPIIGTRSYGESPEKVAELAACAIRGYQENGMIACAKHFPGHGDTAVDSHLALPSVPYAR